MGLSAETPVFVDTNLGTHLVFPVHLDITTGDLKILLGLEHSSCFPDLGEIKIHAVMVKRKSCFYHLPDPMPIKNACEGLVGAWFLCVDASRLQDMPMQEACTHSTSQNLSSSKYLHHIRDIHREAMALQENLSWDNEVSTLDTSDVLDFSTSETNIAFRDKYMKCQAGKCGRDHFIYNKERMEVLSIPVLSKKKSKGILRQINAECFVCETLRDPRKFASTKGTHTSKSTLDLNPEEENQVKNNTIIGDSLSVAKSYNNLLLKHTLRNKQDESSFSICETSNCSLSEKASIAGIISKYFPDSDEVNSCSSPPKNTRDIKMLTKQSEDMHKFEETQQKEINGCTSEIAKSSVNQNSLKKTNDSDFGTTCSFNIIASDVKQAGYNFAGRRCQESNKGEKTVFVKKSETMNTNRKLRKATGFVVSDEYRTCQSCDKLVINSVHRPNSPRSASKMFSLSPPFDMGMEVSSSKIDGYKVGKRLIRAANNIELSVSGKNLRKSMFLYRSGNLPIAKSTVLAKKIAFEISDSDH